MIDPVSKSSKGLAYITYKDPASAALALEALDKTSFQGRILHLLPAIDRKGAVRKGDDGVYGKVDVKAEKEKKMKEAAGKEFNWGMLYMNVSVFTMR